MCNGSQCFKVYFKQKNSSNIRLQKFLIKKCKNLHLKEYLLTKKKKKKNKEKKKVVKVGHSF
jgi:hypothetical protein